MFSAKSHGLRGGRRMRWLGTIVALSVLSACTTTNALQASTSPFPIPSERYAAIVIDARTGATLHDTRADAIRFPASLTKMMTIHLLLDDMRAKRYGLSQPMPVSAYAASRPPSKLGMRYGDTITVDEAIRALTVKSANDVATVVAEFVGGNERNFALLMTAKARALGMGSTTFRNPSGLPDEGQVSTARDMARLALALRRNHPGFTHYYALREFTFRGRRITGHNRVLGRLRGATGMKTGYTRASGSNLATSMNYGGRELIGIILGENSSRSRDDHMVELLGQFAPGAVIEEKKP